jgi:MYXO-CTERM domain-containing protein
MLKYRKLPVALLGAVAITAMAANARAQDGNSVTVGPPQLRDFQLKGERVTPPAQPQPVQSQPAQTTTAPQPRAAQAGPTTTARTPPAPARTVPAPQPRATETPVSASPQPQPQPQPQAVLPESPPAVAPEPAPQAAPVPAQPAQEGGPSFWLILIPATLAALGALLFLRRRRQAAEGEPASAPAIVSAPPPVPRPEPVPRPWLELELKAERAASTDQEARVDFEMVIHNSGESPARNIRINARMFNAGREQDKELGAFFRTRGEGRRTHVIPELPPGERGLIQGSVTMPREEMRALQVNNQALFIPVVGVNLVYDWGDGRTGQTSKSYVIGRELGEANTKMGAFRLDAGPRVYRTVGQRAHSLARRV